jgi:cytochrome c oxidase assembly protein subunit 15
MTWLHRLAVLLAACAVVLVLLGALVTSTGSGLSVAAWPSTFGEAETGAAPSGAALQQAHRVMAALVGLLTILVAAFTWRVDSRPWMKGLALGGVAVVFAQAVYGGIGVINQLPPFFSIFHAALAQLFLGVAIALALFTSPGWLADASPGAATPAGDRVLRRWAVAATAVIYLQVLLGAAMRHSYAADGRPAAFAIPDYPLAFGQLLPLAQLSSWAVVLDYLHRVGALAIVVLSVVAGARVLRHHLAQEELVRPAAMLVLVLLSQVPLGGLAVLTNGHPAVSTLHAFAVTAALGAALVLALRSFRDPLPGRPGGAAVPAGATAAGRTGVAQ